MMKPKPKHFASGTKVSIEKSRAEIERMIVRVGAKNTAFANTDTKAVIIFEAHNRRIRFDLPLPTPGDNRFARDGRGSSRSQGGREIACEQFRRERWRALALVIKAKLESVAAGIETFETAFVANIVLPDGRTVADEVLPRIEHAYQTQTMVPLLSGPAQ